MLDYKKLLDVHALKDKELVKLKQDFINQFDETLKSVNCDPEFIPSIASATFESMMSTRLHYHTPAHILNIFTFAKDNGITLKPYEELAILFHDAVYRPGSEKNKSEDLSNAFMKSLLGETGIAEEIITDVYYTIGATAYHLADEPSEGMYEPFKLVMDLDMSGFSASPGEFASNSALVEKEFHRGYGNDICTLEQFLNGRFKFLVNLQNRKSIFRTPLFLKKFEKRSQTNLANAITEVRRRIEVEL